MRQPYRGNLARAHRLNAARRAAGFRSVRAAAALFGWSLATYRAHEGGTRTMPEEAVRRYADAFNVDYEWLWADRGAGPPVDRGRVAKYAARAKHVEESMQNDPAEWSFARLRAARRLAAFWSVKEAAEYLGLSRTTVAAHESGQNRISADLAKFYGDAFGVREEWLRTGKLPSGYPSEVEALLNQLMELHAVSEGTAQKQFPSAFCWRPNRFSVPTKPKGGEKQSLPPIGDVVPEFATGALFRAISHGGTIDVSSLEPERTWWFPEKYLHDAWSCDPASAIIVVAGDSTSTSTRGDRILVDIATRLPLQGKLYAVLGRNGVRTVFAPAGDGPIIGRACGLIGRLP